ncbi:MAG: HD domain-containing protein [Candidatus Aenigmarchaeota archaeon]|nr:HD domain-containing protein [Candidatus Aenigmarchaeota archaeon]
MPKKLIEKKLDEEILARIKNSKKLKRVYEYLDANPKINSLLEMSNIVLVLRNDYNDHGKVHAKITTLNSLKILDILKKGSISEDKIGTLEDVRVAVMLASYLHDLGNAVGRDEHELLSVILAKPFIEEILDEIYLNDEDKKQKIAATVYDAIMSHMGRHKAESLEAGIVATADGCDMEKGRTRIPFKLGKPDIHTLSALSIDRVEIKEGVKKPVRIEVKMKNAAGVFQVEEILLKKVKATGFDKYVEVVVKVGNRELKYLFER